MTESPVDLFSLELWDYEVERYDGWTLTLAAGSPLNPGAPIVRIQFSGIAYLRLPTEFSHARFRPATPEEIAEANSATALDDDLRVYCFDAETSAGLETRSFVVVAEECRVLQVAVQKALQTDAVVPRGSS